MALFSALTDNFDDNSINGSKWDTEGTVTESGGQLSLVAPAGTGTSSLLEVGNGTYDLTGCAVSIKVVDAAKTGAGTIANVLFEPLRLWDSGYTHYIRWIIEDGDIKAEVDGVAGFTATYNSTTHAYLRIREYSGTTYWDYSADGITWTNGYSVSNPFTMTELPFYILVQAWDTPSPLETCTVIVDDFNVLPVYPVIIPAIGTANAFQTVSWDISSVPAANKNAITAVRITIENVGAANTFYIDNFFASGDFIKNFTDDAFSLSEDYSKGAARSLSETMTVSEVSMVKGIGLNPTETATLSETYSRTWGLVRAFVETMTPSEIYSRSAALYKTFTESMTTAEVSIVKALSRAFAETTTLSETFTRAITRLWEETANLAEVAAKEVSLFISEVMTLTETFARSCALNRTFTETFSISDTFTKGLKWLKKTFIGTEWQKASKSLTTWAKSVKSSTTWGRKYD